MAFVTGLISLTLDSILGGSSDWFATLGGTAASLGPLMVLAALAPGLALVPLAPTQTIFAWLVLMAVVLHFLGPAPAAERSLVGVLSVLQATAAGLLLSLAVALHRVRPVRPG